MTSFNDEFESLKNDGRQDLPRDGGAPRHAYGFNIRDWFAGQAISALMANAMSEPVSITSPTLIDVARKAYQIADAMLDERAKSGK